MGKTKVDLNGKTILITGAAGFIGSNLALRLLRISTNSTIVGVDSLTDYNPVELKEWRLGRITEEEVRSKSRWIFKQGDISEREFLKEIFEKYQFAIVINLAAQAGVRYSIDHPDSYIKSNIIGFYNILEACRNDANLEHLVYASSSSVYGGNTKMPFSTDDMVDHPVSLYAATKKTDELLAHAYSKLYNIPSTGLRFFTVYGPAGRTDMFYFSATNKLRRGEKIDIYNYGKCMRDFTYIDDIIDGIVAVLGGAPQKISGEDGLPVAPYAVYNIGGGSPEKLLDFVDVLQQELVRARVLPDNYDFEMHRNYVPMQKGDVPVTYADTHSLEEDYGVVPSVNIRDGLRKFAIWYHDYYM